MSPKPRAADRRQRGHRLFWWFALAVLLVPVALFMRRVLDVGFEAAVLELKAKVAGAEPEPEAERVTNGGRVVDAVDADTRPLHEQDPRWLPALALAEEGLAQREAALRAHYDAEEGNPFRLKKESAAALAKVEEALADFEAMLEEHGHNRYSRGMLEHQIERCGGLVEDMRIRDNRR